MNSTIENNSSGTATLAAGKFLSFHLSKEEYGIEILKVREIIGMVDVTPLPKTPDFVKGVTNLRGKIIPMIDLRLRFGMPPAEYTNETCIVVVESEREGEGAMQVGCLVDTVSEVLSVEADQFETAPRCADAELEYIDLLAKLEDRVIILLDIDRVIGDLAPALSRVGT